VAASAFRFAESLALWGGEATWRNDDVAIDNEGTGVGTRTRGRRGMHGLPFLLMAIAAAGAVGGCGSLPTLGGAPSTSAPRTDVVGESGQPEPLRPNQVQANQFESAFIAEGNPTGLYALVARGALSCWLSADGPLNATHVFAAEAAPPTRGGAAEIVLHERDRAFRDQRGPRAVRIRFEGAPGGVRVGFSNLRLGTQLAESMARDVATWAKGGTGCAARTLHQPPLVSAGAGRR
jgi:hypothetical protein